MSSALDLVGFLLAVFCMDVHLQLLPPSIWTPVFGYASALLLAAISWMLEDCSSCTRQEEKSENHHNPSPDPCARCEKRTSEKQPLLPVHKQEVSHTCRSAESVAKEERSLVASSVISAVVVLILFVLSRKNPALIKMILPLVGIYQMTSAAGYGRASVNAFQWMGFISMSVGVCTHFGVKLVDLPVFDGSFGWLEFRYASTLLAFAWVLGACLAVTCVRLETSMRRGNIAVPSALQFHGIVGLLVTSLLLSLALAGGAEWRTYMGVDPVAEWMEWRNVEHLYAKLACVGMAQALLAYFGLALLESVSAVSVSVWMVLYGAGRGIWEHANDPMATQWTLSNPLVTSVVVLLGGMLYFVFTKGTSRG